MWAWILGPKPTEKASAEVKLEFLSRGAVLVGFALFCFILACIGSLLIVRRAREEYNEARTENLKELIEGTQEDIRNKQHADA